MRQYDIDGIRALAASDPDTPVVIGAVGGGYGPVHTTAGDLLADIAPTTWDDLTDCATIVPGDQIRSQTADDRYDEGIIAYHQRLQSCGLHSLDAATAHDDLWIIWDDDASPHPITAAQIRYLVGDYAADDFGPEGRLACVLQADYDAEEAERAAILADDEEPWFDFDETCGCYDSAFCAAELLDGRITGRTTNRQINKLVSQIAQAFAEDEATEGTLDTDYVRAMASDLRDEKQWGSGASQSWCNHYLHEEITSATEPHEIDQMIDELDNQCHDDFDGALDRDAVRELAEEYLKQAVASSPCSYDL